MKKRIEKMWYEVKAYFLNKSEVYRWRVFHLSVYLLSFILPGTAMNIFRKRMKSDYEYLTNEVIEVRKKYRKPGKHFDEDYSASLEVARVTSNVNNIVSLRCWSKLFSALDSKPLITKVHVVEDDDASIKI